MSDQQSHGRGGQGNIGPSNTKYVDGEIVRAGQSGDQGGGGSVSTGRGGQGNIGTRGSSVKAAATHQDVVPPQATRNEQDEAHHVGRGGAGNQAHVHTNEQHHGSEHVDHEGLADKVKNKILRHKHE